MCVQIRNRTPWHRLMVSAIQLHFLQKLRPRSSRLLLVTISNFLCKQYLQRYKAIVREEALKIISLFKRYFRDEVKKWLQSNPATTIAQNHPKGSNPYMSPDFDHVASTV